MRLQRLELENYASYYGKHTLDLTCSPDKPVVIILGGTGHGKTMLFDAINWALYGTEYERDLITRRQRQILDYVNESALLDAQKAKRGVEMSCTLHFEHESVQYYINQALVAEPRKSGSKLTSARSDRTTALYEITASGDHRRLKYDTIFLDEILPNNVKDYFLFDGDRIYQLSNPGASQQVRDAIFRVVDLELISNAVKHLADLATEYRRGAGQQTNDGDISAIETKYDHAYERLEQLKENRKKLREEERSVKSQIHALQERLKNLPDTRSLQTDRNHHEETLKDLGFRKDTLAAEIRRLCATSSLAFAQPSLLALLQELDSRRERGLIPKTVSEALLTDLLELGICVCGTAFKKGDKVHKALTDRLKAEKARPSGQKLLDLRFELAEASHLVGMAISQLKKADTEYDEVTTRIRERVLAIEQVDEQLKGLPEEDVSDITQQLDDRRQAQIDMAVALTKVAPQIESCDREIAGYDKEREELGKRDEKVQRLQRRERLAQRASDELAEIYDTFADESRGAVEELTKQEFYKFVRSAATYKVALSEDYELEVIDSHGNRALQRLSMGQSQCLSLAFITAISRVSEKNPPLIIDMPFGRLDRDVHDQVSRRLPEITSQLILFLIPEIEWNETTRANLEPKASHIYRLEFDESNRQTQIIEM